MNREQWLNAALSGLAPRVQERLRAEYQAHLLDMHEAGEPDWAIEGAFGDPQKLNRELKERYLTEYEAKVLASRSRLWTKQTPWIPLRMAGVGGLAMWLLNSFFGGRPWHLWWVPLLIGVLGTLWLLHLRRTLPAEQLALRGSATVSFLTVLMFWSFQTMNLVTWSSALLLLGLVVLLFVGFEFGLNDSLHRKLRTEQGR